jgi:hypothetical protein
MLQKPGRMFAWFVVGALVAVGSARADQALPPTSQPLLAPAVEAPANPVSGAAEALTSPEPSLTPIETPRPLFVNITECRTSCFNDFQACKMHNPYSFCFTIYQYCYCGCNDSCNP